MDSRNNLYHEFNGVSAVTHHIAVKLKRSVLLASPEDPDADSCASIFAFRSYLEWLGSQSGVTINCGLYAPNKPKPNTLFKCMARLGDPCDEIETSLPETMPGLIVSFDYGQFWRMRFNSLSGDVYHIGFDHHPKKAGDDYFPEFGAEVSDPAAPSTTALLYRFFTHEGFPINPAVADCLLVGLLADTGKLTNSLTSPEALETAASLIKLGGNYHGVIEAMRIETSAKTFMAQLKARDKIIIDANLGLGFLSFSQEDLKTWGVGTQDILPLLGLIQNIREVRMAAAYYEREDGTWYGSLRSSPKKGVNVKNIAEALGGGGHDYAAGFVVNMSPNTLFKKIADLIK